MTNKGLYINEAAYATGGTGGALAAGVAKMNFKKFITFSILGGIFWSGFLTAIGYFFGYAANQIEQYIKYAGWIIFGATVIIIIIINLIKKKNSDKILLNGNGKDNKKT